VYYLGITNLGKRERDGTQGAAPFNAGGPYADYARPAEPIEVKLSPQDNKPLAISLQRGATITGRLVDEQGKPKHPVFLGAPPFQGGRVDDEAGRFKIRGVWSSVDAPISVIPMGQYRYSIRLKVPHEKIVAGATIDLGDLQLPKLTGIKNLKGTMTDANGELLNVRSAPKPDAEIGPDVIYNYELLHTTKPIIGSLVPINGSFELEMPEGEYKVVPAGRGVESSIATIKLGAGKVTEVQLKDSAPRPRNPTSNQNSPKG
jgi:hypothetical protein